MIRARCWSLAAVLFGVGVAAAEDFPEFPGPSPEHALLARFVGHWETTGECDGGPDAPPMTNHGTMDGRLLGGRWVVCDHRMDAAGTTIEAVLTVGYDPGRAKYIGTWVDSMQNQLWAYEGDFDEDTQTLSLFADGPNAMKEGELTRFRDSFEFVSDDEIVTRSAALGEDGEWVVFMTGRSQRTQP